MSTVTLSKPHWAMTSAEKPDGIASQALTQALPDFSGALSLFMMSPFMKRDHRNRCREKVKCLGSSSHHEHGRRGSGRAALGLALWCGQAHGHTSGASEVGDHPALRAARSSLRNDLCRP